MSAQGLWAGLPFPVPEILEFVAFRDSGKIFQQFFRDFREFSSGTPEQTPEAATAFSSFLIVNKAETAKPLRFENGVAN